MKNKRDSLNKVFFSLCLSSAIWLFFYFLAYNTNFEKRALILFRIGYCGVVFLAITYFHYAVTFLKLKKFNSILISAYATGIIWICTIFFTPYFIKGVYTYFWGYYPKAGILHPIFLVFFLGLLSFSMVLYFYFFFFKKTLSLIEFVQVKYIFLAFAIYNFACVDFVPNYGISVYPFGSIPTFFFLAIFSYTIVRHHLMDIRIFISRALAFSITYTFLLGIPFFFAYRMYPVLYPIMGLRWWSVPVGLLTFFASIAPLAYDQIRRNMEAKFFVEQKRYQNLLLQAASGMALERDLNRLSKLIVYIIKRTVKIDFAAIFLKDKEQKKYRLKAMRDSGLSISALDFAYDDPLVKFFKTKKEPQFYENLSSSIKNTLKFPKRVGLIIPSMIEDDLLGFVVLGEKNNREPYSEDDINVFKILTNQTAMAIENCLFFEEFKNAQEKIFTAEKLASIGGMADGVAHQIKNRLNHFSIASGELKCEIEDFKANHKDLVEQNPDLEKTFKYSIEIADSLIKNVKMTDGIVRGILTYARVEEKETFFSHFSLKEIIDAALELLKIKHELQEFPLAVDLDNCDMIYGVKAQILESIYNVLDNSYEASIDKKHHLPKEEKEKFTPLIKLKLTEESYNYHIEISDNGIGMKPETRQKIFAPFFTTKSSYKSGTGIGMYVVKRIVEENHKGRIWFESAHMQGTKFTIELPKK